MGAETFTAWAIVELFGHKQLAGQVTEQRIAGEDMLRIEVPEVNGTEAFTRLYGGRAVYGITPCTEEQAREVAAFLGAAPLPVYIPAYHQLGEGESGEVVEGDFDAEPF